MSEETESIEKVVGDALRNKHMRLAVAESCTGGLVSHRITNIPGSSDYFNMGLVVYSNTAKKQILDVPKFVLDSFGAVSSEMAKAMAEGVRKSSRTDVGLSVTGIAGPSGATPTKPVGLVYIGLASSRPTIVREFRFQGSREEIKQQASEKALGLVLEVITKE